MSFIRLLHGAQVALAGYGAYHSFIAVRLLLGYEETAEQGAGWSNEAARQLRLTRTTQASGAVAIVLSLLAAGTLAAKGNDLPWYVTGLTSPIMLVGVWGARGHIKSFWAPSDGKTVGTRVPVPGMTDYNEAERKTEELLKVLEYLEYSWLVTSFVSAIGGY